MTAPRGFPDRIWVVFFHGNGERHTFFKEPLEGMAKWAKGLNATVVEYQCSGVAHVPPPPKKTKKS